VRQGENFDLNEVKKKTTSRELQGEKGVLTGKRLTVTARGGERGKRVLILE